MHSSEVWVLLKNNLKAERRTGHEEPEFLPDQLDHTGLAAIGIRKMGMYW